MVKIVDLKSLVRMVSGNRMGGGKPAITDPPVPPASGGAVSVEQGDRVTVPHLGDDEGVVDSVATRGMVWVEFSDPPRRVTVQPDQCVLMPQSP